MAKITTRVRPYETLIRHNPDGSLAAHYLEISEVLDGTEVISASISSPMPINFASLSAILDAAMVSTISQNSNLNKKIVDLELSIDKLHDEINETKEINE